MSIARELVTIELMRVRPNSASIPPVSARWPAQINSSTPLTDVRHYASSPGHRAQNLPFFCCGVRTIGSTHRTYPLRDSQAELPG